MVWTCQNKGGGTREKNVGDGTTGKKKRETKEEIHGCTKGHDSGLSIRGGCSERERRERESSVATHEIEEVRSKKSNGTVVTLYHYVLFKRRGFDSRARKHVRIV